MLTSFKEKLNAPPQSKIADSIPVSLHTQPADSNHYLRCVDRSTTPDGSPPPDLHNTLGLQQQQPNAAAPAANTSSILAALANMARQQTAVPQAAPSTQPQDNPYTVSNGQNNLGQQPAAISQPAPYQPLPQPVNVPATTASFPTQLPPATNPVQSYPAQPNAFPAAAPAVPAAGIDPTVQQQLLLIKALSDQGFTPDKIAGIIAAMSAQSPQVPGAAATQFPGQPGQNPWGQRPDESRDRTDFQDGVRSPGRYGRRSRSPSPGRRWGRDSPARRRDDDYGRDSPGRNRGRGYGNDFRQRSPLRRGRSPTPPRHGAPKFVDFDPTLGPDQIKGIFLMNDTSIAQWTDQVTVLSRTLFVGGVT